uniref:Uncharacterized protein n=1 Tax=Anguilla anguilla TaxID=7936 RepID=A0A0E9PU24_ANGAN
MSDLGTGTMFQEFRILGIWEKYLLDSAGGKARCDWTDGGIVRYRHPSCLTNVKLCI